MANYWRSTPLYRSLAHIRQDLAAREGVCLKKPYETQAEAESYARLIRRRYGAQRAYLCWCGHWHLTTR